MKKRFLKSLSGVLDYLEKEWGTKVADDFLIKVDTRIDALQHHPFIGSLSRYKNIRGASY